MTATSLACAQVAHVAKDNHVEDVLDSLLVTVAKFTAPLDVNAGYPGNVVAFGRDRVAQEAMVTLFTIVADYGDMLRGGWAQVMACVLRLHKVRVDSALCKLFMFARGSLLLDESGNKLTHFACAVHPSSNHISRVPGTCLPRYNG